MDKPANKGGRPKGSLNKRTVNLRRAVQSGQTPLEFLLEQMHDQKNDLSVRMDAAKSAAGYCHARLSQVETRDVTEYDGNPDSITTDQLAAIVSGAGRSHDAAKKKGKGKLH